MIFTKRPERLYEFCARYGIGSGNNFPGNVWLGVTAENQEQADKRKEALEKVKAERETPADDPAMIQAEQGKLFLIRSAHHVFFFGRSEGRLGEHAPKILL